MYLILLAVIYLAFISLGLPDSLLGAAWPSMRQGFDVPVSYMGIISMIISGGTILSSLLSERLTKYFGTHAVTTASIFLTAVALFGFSTVKEFYLLCVWAVPYGLGAGAIDAALNNYVSMHYTSKHMNWLHSFWGVGTIISPYIMSYALSISTWKNGYRLVSYIQIVIMCILIMSLPLWKIHKNNNLSENYKEIIGIGNVLKTQGVSYLLIGFFSYCAAEAVLILWTSSYLVAVKGISEQTAAAFASLFFIGITVGRFISGFISDKLGDRNMIRLGTVVIAAGILCIIMPITGNILVLAGFVITGIGCGPVYPCVIHSTPENFGKDNSQAIIGVQMASAYIGSTFMPPVFGLIANHISMKLMPLYISVFFILMIIMLEKAFSKAKANKNI